MAGADGFNERTNPIIQRLVDPVCSNLRLNSSSREPSILWYYTPMALGAEPPSFKPDVIVFDAMDELAAFRGAPAALVHHESALLARADLVFAGGPSLYEARRDRHHAVHCFPSGVESDHFALAPNGVASPADLESHPKPILGFYGVIDERIDLELIAAIADHRPDWTVMMVGPLAKISPDDLPRRSNIVYYGKQDYSALPGFLASFDVALLPFAINEATRFISPTKTLEYLAGGKPVVSTPILDVVSLYGDVIKVGGCTETFIAAIEQTLCESPAVAIDRQAKAAALVAQCHWDLIADRMWTLIESTRQAAMPRPRALAAR
jgi:glycosyltransferase involved in cell wall biosynthesis